MMDAYPLTWPSWWPRLAQHERKQAPYQVTFTRARDALLRELRLGGCKNVIISSNLPLRRDGLPYADCSEPRDPGIAVYFDTRKGESKCIPNDCWKTTRENLRAVGLAYEGLRMIERTGSGPLLARAYSGFACLPAGDRVRPWWEVLCVERGESLDRIRAAYHELSMQHHPDRGGDPARMSELNRAWQEAKA